MSWRGLAYFCRLFERYFLSRESASLYISIPSLRQCCSPLPSELLIPSWYLAKNLPALPPSLVPRLRDRSVDLFPCVFFFFFFLRGWRCSFPPARVFGFFPTELLLLFYPTAVILASAWIALTGPRTYGLLAEHFRFDLFVDPPPFLWQLWSRLTSLSSLLLYSGLFFLPLPCHSRHDSSRSGVFVQLSFPPPPGVRDQAFPRSRSFLAGHDLSAALF